MSDTPAGVTEAPALPAGILEIGHLEEFGIAFWATVQVEVYTKGKHFTHLVQVVFQTQPGVPLVLLLQPPYHPHVSGNRYCIDYAVSDAVVALAKKKMFLEATVIVQNALSYINVKSCYSYYGATKCSVCGEYTFETNNTCASCRYTYCEKHSGTCRWCGANSGLCARCSNSLCPACAPYENIISLHVSLALKRLFIQNDIRSVLDFMNTKRLTEIKGVGEAKEIKILKELFGSDDMQEHIYFYICRYLRIDLQEYLPRIRREDSLRSRTIIVQMYLNM